MALAPAAARAAGTALALGGALLLISPYLISSLGRGITPPADGVSDRPLAELAARPAGLGVRADRADRPRSSGAVRAESRALVAHRRWASRIALAASVIGVLVWSPRGGWPDWYTFLWTPALLLVTLPAPRWAAITGIALVAGSSSALVTWGAELAGRVQVAQRDVARLGNEPDPLAVPLLERFGEQLRRVRRARNRLGDVRAVARLRARVAGLPGAPRRCGPPRARCVDELVLDSLDLPPSLLSTMVRDLPAGDTHARSTQVLRVPGRALRPAGAGSRRTRS